LLGLEGEFLEHFAAAALHARAARVAGAAVLDADENVFLGFWHDVVSFLKKNCTTETQRHREGQNISSKMSAKCTEENSS